MEIVTRKERRRRIWIVVISLILLVAGAAGAAVFINKRDDLLPKIVEEKRLNRDQEAKIADLQAKLLGFSAPYGFRTEEDVLMPEAPPTPINPDVLRSFLNRWRARLDERYGIKTYRDWTPTPDPASPGLMIPKLFEEVQKLREAAQKEEQEIVKESGSIDPNFKWSAGGGGEIKIPEGSLTSQIAVTSKEAVDAQKKADDEIKRLREEYINAAKARDEKKLEIKTKRQALDQALKEAQGKHTEAVQAASKEKQARLLEKKELQERLDWIELTRQEAQERQETDGKIIHADVAHGLVFIDIRQKDGLFRGTKFKVFSLKKGGTKKMKGEIQVLAVLPDYSRCAILKNLDRDEPMAGGDFVFDEFYDRVRDLEFAFAGRLVGPSTPTELEQRMRDYKRYHFSAKARRETNYLVVGEGYEKDPNYIEAIKFGIKIIREKDFYSFLGLDY